MSEPYAPTLAGDVADDDAAIIDEFFEPPTLPPDGASTGIVVNEEQAFKPKQPTQIVSGTFTYDANSTGTPQEVLNANPRRKFLHLAVIGATDTEYASFADDKGLLNSMSAFRLYTGQTLDDIAHTGKLWMHATTAGTLTVTWYAVIGGEDD